MYKRQPQQSPGQQHDESDTHGVILRGAPCVGVDEIKGQQPHADVQADERNEQSARPDEALQQRGKIGTFNFLRGSGKARADHMLEHTACLLYTSRDSFEVAKGLGLSVPRSNICGGGSRSMLWKRILANVLGIPLDVVKTSEGPGYGAALLAMVACGEYETVAQACSALVRTVDTVEPDASLTALYEDCLLYTS